MDSSRAAELFLTVRTVIFNPLAKCTPCIKSIHNFDLTLCFEKLTTYIFGFELNLAVKKFPNFWNLSRSKAQNSNSP